jgi:hypothetical protein
VGSAGLITNLWAVGDPFRRMDYASRCEPRYFSFKAMTMSCQTSSREVGRRCRDLAARELGPAPLRRAWWPTAPVRSALIPVESRAIDVAKRARRRILNESCNVLERATGAVAAKRAASEWTFSNAPLEVG